MGARRSLQEAVRKCVIEFMPTVPFYFVDGNGPEEITPYCTIEVPMFQSTGREETSTHINAGVSDPYEQGYLVIREPYEATVRFSFTGKNKEGNDGGDDAYELSTLIVTPLMQMKFRENNLSYRRKSIVRKIPKLRETQWYDAYVLDVVFAFYLETKQYIDSIDVVKITGTIYAPDGETIVEQIIIPDEEP